LNFVRDWCAFDRMTGEIDTLLARIDSRLAEIDASRVGVIDVDPNVADLLRRS
jgi:hypothetical protein